MVIESYSYSSLSLTPSVNSLELNTPENIMLCLTTNPTDEGTEFNPKWKRTIPKLYHHIKSSIKVQQNKNINLNFPSSQPPINSQTVSSLQLEQSANPYIIQNLTFDDKIQTKSPYIFRLMYQNVGGLELSNDAFTLEKISDSKLTPPT